jgi:adenylate cyclase class 2
VVIAIDETPVGVFVEIEGGEDAIHAVARGLGKRTSDYITDSYRFLFLQHRDANGLCGHDMVFAGSPTVAPGAKVGRAEE